jgi:sulfur-oxidizing protein SoxZ
MSTKSVPRVRVPKEAKKGEIIEIKTLISHDMESGQRKTADGQPIPRKIIKEFVATFDGKEVFRADWHPAISANPYQSFFYKAEKSGKFEFTWVDDDGTKYSSTAELSVS